MDWEIRWWGERRRIAVLVSRQDHCLLDLLWRGAAASSTRRS